MLHGKPDTIVVRPPFNPFVCVGENAFCRAEEAIVREVAQAMLAKRVQD